MKMMWTKYLVYIVFKVDIEFGNWSRFTINEKMIWHCTDMCCDLLFDNEIPTWRQLCCLTWCCMSWYHADCSQCWKNHLQVSKKLIIQLPDFSNSGLKPADATIYTAIAYIYYITIILTTVYLALLSKLGKC